MDDETPISLLFPQYVEFFVILLALEHGPFNGWKS